MHLAQALQVSLRLKLPVRSSFLQKRKFIRQASRLCQRALDPHTDWPTRCHCLFVAWLHLKCYCDSDSMTYKSCHRSTATSLAKTQLPIAESPEKVCTFFSFESATASCVSSGDLVATFSDFCWSGLVSAGTPSFVLDPTTVTPV